MKKSKSVGGLVKKLILTGMLATSVLPKAKGQVEDYIYNNGMNPYSQPNIQMSYDKNKLDFYGSGDVNNDNTITLADATLIRAGQGTNYRADVNGDKVVNSSDATIIENYKNGTLTHLPSDWNNLNRSERISWLTKMLAIDKTDERVYIPNVYMCGEFSREHQINLFGIQNLENYTHYSLFAQDGNDNAKFNIPVYMVATKITPGSSSISTELTGHFINGILAGPTSGERYAEDPTNFSHWYFFEPQTDVVVVPGNFSMNEDENVKIRWFGKHQFDNVFINEDLINFDLENGQVNAITSIHPWLLLTNPNAPDVTSPTATFPSDKEVPYTSGLNLVQIIESTPPTNVKDDKDTTPTVTYTFTSGKTNTGICTDVSFDVPVTWNIKDDAGNDTNYVQMVRVRDLIVPSFTEPADIKLPEEDGVDPTKTGLPTNLNDNSGLAVSTSYTDFIQSDGELEKIIKRTWTATDACGNTKTEDQLITLEKPEIPDTTSPTATFPSDKEVPYTAGINLEEIIELTPPTNVKDDKDTTPTVTYTFTSGKTNTGICTDVSFDVPVTWKIVDDAGNYTNYVQMVRVKDLVAPTFIEPTDKEVKLADGVEPSLTGLPTEIKDNSGLPVTTSYTDFTHSDGDLEKIIKRTWTATDVCGNTKTEDQYITVKKITGIDDGIEEIKCGFNKIFPVPTVDRATFDYSTTTSEEVDFSVIDFSGKVVDNFKVESNPGENSFEYSFKEEANAKAGMYFVKMNAKNCNQVKKVIVK